MKRWQMWLIIFYVCFARVASEEWVIGVGITAFLAAAFFGLIKQ